MKVLALCLVLLGCNSPRTIPVGQSIGGSELIRADNSKTFDWKVESDSCLVYGCLRMNWCESNGIVSYLVTVDSVVIR